MMVAELWLICAMFTCSVCGESRYAFYRDMYEGSWGGGGENARRVYGGEEASSDAWPAACVLLDRYWNPRCSGSVVAPRWVLTAAHCVVSRLAYVKYDTTKPTTEGQYTSVYYLYRHPEYKVEHKDFGMGMDVAVLHNDVGLVRTLDEMKVHGMLPVLRSISTYTMEELDGEDVQVFGFGRTEKLSQGERLVLARLRIVPCWRTSWVPCMCGSSGATPAGVCSGDSGGPVVYQGVQIAVTSMGPVDCAAPNLLGPRVGDLPSSVFTALHSYAPLINATIMDTDNALHMRGITPHNEDNAAPPAPTLALTTLALTLAARAL